MRKKSLSRNRVALVEDGACGKLGGVHFQFEGFVVIRLLQDGVSGGKGNETVEGCGVTLPRVDCSYVFPFYSMFPFPFSTSPAVPVHDPRGRHVIWHHMTDSLGHLPAARVDAWPRTTITTVPPPMLTYGQLRLCQRVFELTDRD